MTLHDVAAIYRQHRDPPEVIAAFTPAQDLAYATEYLGCMTCGQLHCSPALLAGVLAKCTHLGEFDWGLLGACPKGVRRG